MSSCYGRQTANGVRVRKAFVLNDIGKEKFKVASFSSLVLKTNNFEKNKNKIHPTERASLDP